MSAAFIAEGIEILQNPQPLADRLSPVLETTRRKVQRRSGDGFAMAPSAARPDPLGTTLQDERFDAEESALDSARGSERRIPAPPLPESPETLARILGGAQVASAALLAIGKAPRPAAAALAATTAVNLSQHAFWNEVDPELKKSERTQFLTGISKLGGLLIAAADTEGQPSLGWRGRRAAHEARERAEALTATAAALAATARERGSDLADNARERTSDFADTAKEHLHIGEQPVSRKGRRAARKAQSRANSLAETAREKAPEVAETMRERGAHLAETAREKGTRIAEVARDRGPELAEAARERGSELAERARERGSEMADTFRDQVAPNLADTARHQAHKAAELARAKTEVVRAKAHERKARRM